MLISQGTISESSGAGLAEYCPGQDRCAESVPSGLLQISNQVLQCYSGCPNRCSSAKR